MHTNPSLQQAVLVGFMKALPVEAVSADTRSAMSAKTDKRKTALFLLFRRKLHPLATGRKREATGNIGRAADVEARGRPP